MPEDSCACPNNISGVRGRAQKDTCKLIIFPKLKIIGLGWDTSGEFRDFDQAKYLPFGRDDLVIVVEEQVVRSLEDLLQLVSIEKYKDKEYLEIKFLSVVVGG